MAERPHLYADHLLAQQLRAQAEARRHDPAWLRLLLEALVVVCLLAIVALIARSAS